MNVLFLTYDFPYPTNTGGKNRAYNLIKQTAMHANVFLLSFVRDDYNPELNEEMEKIGVRKIKVVKRKKLKTLSNISKVIRSKDSIFRTLYFDNEVLDELKRIIIEDEIDIVHYESSYTGYFIDALKHLKIKQVLGTENIEFMLYEDYAKKMKKVYLRPFVNFMAKRLRNEELLMVKNADLVTTITQDEADILEKLCNKKSQVVANGIDLDIFSFKENIEPKKNILFVGNFTYFPNVDAMEFFCTKVFPLLEKDITLTIIGKNSSALSYNHQNIVKKNFVVDIIDEYRNADALVFPVRVGGGTNFKVLEAMALGTPIIAFPQRLSGLGAKENVHFLPAKTGSDYIDQIDKLYRSVKLKNDLVENARKLVEESFSWEKIGKDLLTVWKKTQEK